MTTAARARPEDADLVELYLADIGRYPLLTPADERRLGHAVATGRQAARELAGGHDRTEAGRAELRRLVAEGARATEIFVASNLRLVVSIAKGYLASGMPLLDLVQEGNIGLMRAVERFDPDRGFRFSTYASWAIRQAVARGVANAGRTIRLPVRIGEVVRRVRGAQRDFEAEHGRLPRVEELAERLAMEPARVAEALGFGREPVSLSAPLGEPGTRDLELGDVVEDAWTGSPAEQAVRSLELEEMARAMRVLDEREHRVLSLRFGLDDDEPVTLVEVGRRLDLSGETARSIQVRALKKLRRSLRER